jgi:hypothetical protein
LGTQDSQEEAAAALRTVATVPEDETSRVKAFEIRLNDS